MDNMRNKIKCKNGLLLLLQWPNTQLSTHSYTLVAGAVHCLGSYLRYAVQQSQSHVPLSRTTDFVRKFGIFKEGELV